MANASLYWRVHLRRALSTYSRRTSGYPIQLFDWGWDSHGAGENESLNAGFKDKCRNLDRPLMALITDLKQRGLFEDTLIVWSGEFDPMCYKYFRHEAGSRRRSMTDTIRISVRLIW